MANNINFDIIIKSQKALSSFRQLQKTAESTKKKFTALNRTMGQYNKSTSKVRKANSIAGKSFGSLTKQIALGNIAAKAISSVFSGSIRFIKDAGSAAISSAANFEKLQTQFEVLTGSASTAKDLFEDLTKFSAQTPFRLNDIAESAQKLLAFGFSAEETKSQLRTLGDVAGASGQDLGEIARILGQIRSKGNLTGERNIQLLERGINLYPELSRVLNVSEKDLEGLQKQGKITFEAVNEALKLATSSGGKFFEGTIRLAKTATGVFSTVKDNLDLIGASLGKQLLPFLKFAGIQIINISQNILKWVKNNITLGDALAFVVDAIKSVSNTLANGVTAVNFIRKAFIGFQATVELVALAVTKFLSKTLLPFTKGAALLGKAFGKNTDTLDAFNRGLEDTSNVKFSDILEDADKKMRDLDASTLSTTKTITDSAQKIASDLKKFIVSESSSPSESGNTSTSPVAVDSGPDPRIAKEKSIQDQLLKLKQEAALAERELEVLKEVENGVRQESRLGGLLASFEQEEAIKFEARLREQEGTQEQLLTLQEIKASAARQEIEDRMGTEQFLLDLETEMSDLKIANARREEQEKQQIRMQTINATSQMFGSLANLASVGGKKLFKIQKALNIAQVISSGVAAFMRSQELPYPANIPAGISAVATSAAALVRAQSTKAPKYENGGIVPGTGTTGDGTLARVNAGEMILNRRQQSNMFNQLNGGGSTNVNSNVVVEIDGEAIGRAVSKQVANGLQLGEVV